MSNPKLKLKDVFDIREALEEGAKSCDLARRYKVHRQTIYGIKSGRTWKKRIRRAIAAGGVQ